MLQWDLGKRVSVPERLVDFKMRTCKFSSVRRKVETTVKFVLNGMKLRFIDEIWACLQEIPVKEHGFRFGSQFWSKDGFGRVALKLMSCWVGSLEAEEAAQE